MQQTEFIPPVYQVKFVFKDGKDLNVNVEAQYLTQFFDELSNKKIYWNQTKTSGFWTNLDDVRFVQTSLLVQQIPQLPPNGRIEKIESSPIHSDPEKPASSDGITPAA
jgi:hypothetical protein